MTSLLYHAESENRVWNGINENGETTEASTGNRATVAAGTIHGSMSRGERPNARPNTVSVTLLEDRSGLGAIGLPRVVGTRGQEVQVTPRSAVALERAGTAVRVSTAKMGAAQQRLLLTLYDLTLEEEQPTRGALLGSAGFMAGVTLGLYQGTRLPWSSSLVTDRDTSAARSSVAQALANLERRGLVLRFPIGGHRTQQVELTQAGRRVASALRQKP